MRYKQSVFLSTLLLLGLWPAMADDEQHPLVRLWGGFVEVCGMALGEPDTLFAPTENQTVITFEDGAMVMALLDWPAEPEHEHEQPALSCYVRQARHDSGRITACSCVSFPHQAGLNERQGRLADLADELSGLEIAAVPGLFTQELYVNGAFAGHDAPAKVAIRGSGWEFKIFGEVVQQP